jgi:2'-5' RNA ligase
LALVTSQATRRLFFALWPDAALREAIVRRRERLGDPGPKRVPDHNLHLTLLFLGDQPADRLDHILGAGEAIGVPPFDLVLDRFGRFDSARVAWLGGDAVPDAIELVAVLGRRMQGIGVEFRTRPFVPHVTLFRKVASLAPAPVIEPLLWRVTSFSLIESIASRPYQVLRTFSLS